MLIKYFRKKKKKNWREKNKKTKSWKWNKKNIKRKFLEKPKFEKKFLILQHYFAKYFLFGILDFCVPRPDLYWLSLSNFGN